MARGDPPFPLENLVPYFRGGRFAMIAVRGRRYGVPELDRQVERYVAMADRYMAAAVATVRLRRQRAQEAAGAGPPSEP
ncbi:MAG TPA: hypothetical protein VKF59_18740 [Candidatus Dormibacteraeota bacterium]|nr:hypothetical protein [Candidatus Dormibacteraeota bacterium]